MAELLALLSAGLVVAECARAVAGSRRSRKLNRALHELRRPLQSMTLAIERPAPDLACAGACLEQARGALAGLDRAINGGERAPRLVRTALAEIVGSLERRWRFADVRVEAADPNVQLVADPIGLGAALDNLVSNALSHGTGPVEVRALTAAGSARIEVRDGGCAPRPPGEGGGDPRRGHGLGIAAELARRHGGTVIPPRGAAGGGTVAALSLPTVARGQPS